MKQKPIVVYLDTARVHTQQQVLDLADQLDVIMLFNAEYSPWINPVGSFLPT